jgi:hypothetical protein
MINNIEDKSQKELVEIVKIQMEEYQKLERALYDSTSILGGKIQELEKELWDTQRREDKAVTRAAEMIEKKDEQIEELEKERVALLSCLLGISNECIGEIAMNYKLDAQMIGESIYAATGKTNPELAKALKESK